MTSTLRTENVTLINGKKILCRDVSLTIPPGSIVGILGANGCGKTTLLHTLAGLHKPNNGRVYLNEIAIEKWHVRDLARARGILFQDFHSALPITVREYCQASRYPHQPFSGRLNSNDLQAIHAALTQMDLAHLAHHSITTLSGGEKRRLALAALLIQMPTIYMLDEPTNHLDVKHQLLTLNYFTQLASTNQATVIMSLHDVNIAQRFCDYLVLMFDDGTVIQGKPEKVLTVINLSCLYECSMTPIISDDSIYWQARL